MAGQIDTTDSTAATGTACAGKIWPIMACYIDDDDQ
jgi:hypothetical protein